MGDDSKEGIWGYSIKSSATPFIKGIVSNQLNRFTRVVASGQHFDTVLDPSVLSR